VLTTYLSVKNSGISIKLGQAVLPACGLEVGSIGRGLDGRCVPPRAAKCGGAAGGCGRLSVVVN
jgi:hypothetical protein